jgi:(p)ppGpp synthase/HD superfamily hydrolase
MPSAWNQEKYLEAYRFAADAHRGQPIKGRPDLPYIIHPSMVSMEVIAALQAENGLDGNLAVQCALLHDVIEDAGVSQRQIENQFGKQVALGVVALSKDPAAEESKQMADCLRRIKEQPREIWMVKLADRVTNLQPPPGEWDTERVERYRQEAIGILDSLGTASGTLANRLRDKIETYGRSA